MGVSRGEGSVKGRGDRGEWTGRCEGSIYLANLMHIDDA